MITDIDDIAGLNDRDIELEAAAEVYAKSAIADPAGVGHVGALLFGMYGLDDAAIGEIEVAIAEEIGRAYVAGATRAQYGAGEDVVEDDDEPPGVVGE